MDQPPLLDLRRCQETGRHNRELGLRGRDSQHVAAPRAEEDGSATWDEGHDLRLSISGRRGTSERRQPHAGGRTRALPRQWLTERAAEVVVALEARRLIAGRDSQEPKTSHPAGSDRTVDP